MTLYLIGAGLCSEKDLTLNSIEILKQCDRVYFESYTSKLAAPLASYESLIKQSIIAADRTMIEQEDLLEESQSKKVAILFPGDPFAATTHSALLLEAKQRGIPFFVIPNASIFSAVGATGLQLYKFGKVASIPLERHYLESPCTILAENLSIGAHTLFLLECEGERFVSIPQTISYLLSLSKLKLFSEDTICVGVARLGWPNQFMKAGTAASLLNQDFGDAPQSLIIPGKLHFKEEEALKLLY